MLRTSYVSIGVVCSRNRHVAVPAGYPNVEEMESMLMFSKLRQSPFMNKIGGSSRVQDELTSALAEGRGVTAKVRWVSKVGEDGRNRWIHCTPLIGSNGQIGVWMVVLVDDDQGLSRRWKQAPPVATHRGKDFGSSRDAHHHQRASEDLDSSGPNSMRGERAQHHREGRNLETASSTRSESPNSVRIY